MNDQTKEREIRKVERNKREKKKSLKTSKHLKRMDNWTHQNNNWISRNVEMNDQTKEREIKKVELNKSKKKTPLKRANNWKEWIIQNIKTTIDWNVEMNDQKKKPLRWATTEKRIETNKSNQIKNNKPFTSINWGSILLPCCLIFLECRKCEGCNCGYKCNDSHKNEGSKWPALSNFVHRGNGGIALILNQTKTKQDATRAKPSQIQFAVLMATATAVNPKERFWKMLSW